MPKSIHRPLAHCRATILVAAMLIVGSLLAACETNPATGRTYFQALNREQSIELGRSAAPELIQGYGGAISDSTINTYVRNVGLSMAQHTEGDYPTLPWEFTVLDSDIINAFALPGGQVFISRALLEEMNTEAQMAGVLGHEIGHVTAEHINERLSRQMALQLGVTLAAVAVDQSGSQLAQTVLPVVADGAGLFALSFDRNQELESDRLGMRYMTKAGYNPRGQLEVMEILGAAAAGSAQPPEWMSTHPHAETRIRAIIDLLETKYAYTHNNPDYAEYPERFESQMLSRLRTLPPPQQTSRRMMLMPDLAEGETLPPEVTLAINASWCGICRAELQALQAQR